MAAVYSFAGESRSDFLGRIGMPLVVAYMVSSPGVDCATVRTFATRPEARKWVIANLKRGGALHSRIQELFPRGDQIAFDSEVLDELDKVLDYTYVSHMDCGTIDIFAMRPISRQHSTSTTGSGGDGTTDILPTSVYWHILAEDIITPSSSARSSSSSSSSGLMPMSPSPSPMPAPVEFSDALASAAIIAPVATIGSPPSVPEPVAEPPPVAVGPIGPPVVAMAEPVGPIGPASELLVALRSGSTGEATTLYRRHGKDLDYMKATFAAATLAEVSQLKGFIRNCFELAMGDRQKANKAFHKMMKQYDISVLSEE